MNVLKYNGPRYAISLFDGEGRLKMLLQQQQLDGLSFDRFAVDAHGVFVHDSFRSDALSVTRLQLVRTYFEYNPAVKPRTAWGTQEDLSLRLTDDAQQDDINACRLLAATNVVSDIYYRPEAEPDGAVNYAVRIDLCAGLEQLVEAMRRALAHAYTHYSGPRGYGYVSIPNIIFAPHLRTAIRKDSDKGILVVQRRALREM